MVVRTKWLKRTKYDHMLGSDRVARQSALISRLLEAFGRLDGKLKGNAVYSSRLGFAMHSGSRIYNVCVV